MPRLACKHNSLVDVDMQSLVSFLLHVHCASNKSSGESAQSRKSISSSHSKHNYARRLQRMRSRYNTVSNRNAGRTVETTELRSFNAEFRSFSMDSPPFLVF